MDVPDTPHPGAADNASNGQRGLRARPSPALADLLREAYGIEDAQGAADLGGSSNLNLLVRQGPKQCVARVYRPYVSEARLLDIQMVRRVLLAGGVPCSDVVETRQGEPWARLGDRLVEVEDYIERDAGMDSWERLQDGLPTLGRIHSLLRDVRVSEEGATPLFANHVEPLDALGWTQRATRRIRAWSPLAEEMRLAQDMEELAQALHQAERPLLPSLRRQLVHGDFWDNNVFFRAGRIALVADLDFMGERARIDDLALTLYFTSLSLAQPDELGERIAGLRRLVDAYDSGQEERLTSAERAALPLAMARQPLWAGRWLALLDEQAQARRLAGEMPGEVGWGLRIIHDLDRWQDGLA